MTAKRVLIVKTSSMGDVVHTLPAVSDLHRMRPDIAIDWMVEPAFAPIVRLHPGVKNVHALAWRKWRKRLWSSESRQALSAFRNALRSDPYDLIVDLQGLLKSALWARQARGLLGGPDWASAREPMASLLYQRRAHAPKRLHAIERSRILTAALAGYEKPNDAPDFGIGVAGDAPSWSPPHPWAVLIPNASRPEKFWPNARWQAVGQRFQALGWLPVVLWGNPAERAMAEDIASGCGGSVPPFLSVGDMASVLAGAKVVVGLDTGFTHLGAALGRPTIGIYCDHEPRHAGITGNGGVDSIGGVGQSPSLADVMSLLERRLALAYPQLRAG